MPIKSDALYAPDPVGWCRPPPGQKEGRDGGDAANQMQRMEPGHGEIEPKEELSMRRIRAGIGERSAQHRRDAFGEFLRIFACLNNQEDHAEQSGRSQGQDSGAPSLLCAEEASERHGKAGGQKHGGVERPERQRQMF